MVQGSVLDVAVDIRQDSPTFGKYISIELSEKAFFSYKVDNYYNREFERGITYNGPYIGIN